ncbi:MAG: GntR family transcriptional regulator [Betaproteobacteria bacterium]|nr:MAG: GntR family transcriptional regulator [Betaproteobacteria bacterium]
MVAPRTPTGNPPARTRSVALNDGALYQRVAERLRERIVAHTLAPGSWIDEQALTAELGISRTPLREALKVLASEGLVTMKLRRGAYVTEVSERDLTEVFHLLSLLESDAAAAVARDASSDELAELAALHQKLEATVADRDAFFKMVADLRKVMKLYRHHSLFKQGRLEASLKEHRKLMTALKARNAALAQQLMQQHLAHGKDAASRA